MTRNDPPGFDPALYDADFFTWTRQQAAALGAMSREPAVDVDRIAEEIEDLGKRDLLKVASTFGRLVEHLVKIEGNPHSRDLQHWRDEARLFARDGSKRYTPGMRQLLDMSAIWQDGVVLALDYFRDRGVIYEAPRKCPYVPDDLLTPFDLDRALARLASARGTDLAADG